jgi:hypothetical protein
MQPNAIYKSHGSIKPYNTAQHRHDSSLNLITNLVYKYQALPYLTANWFLKRSYHIITLNEPVNGTIYPKRTPLVVYFTIYLKMIYQLLNLFRAKRDLAELL